MSQEHETPTTEAGHEGNGHGAGPHATQPKKRGSKKMATATATPKKKAAPANKKDKDDRGPSLLDAAAQVLKASKKPMKVKDIYAKIEEKGLWSAKKGKTPDATLAAAIYVEINRKGSESRFEKVGRGEFTYRPQGG